MSKKTKWIVENQTKTELTINITDIKQVVYIYNCQDTTLIINGKLTSITIDSSKKAAVVLETSISAVEIINSKKCQLQIKEQAPTIQIDNSEEIQLYFDLGINECEILTSKSSSVNFSVPNVKDPEGDLIEHFVPEQFRTILKDGKLIVGPVEHE